MDRDKFPTLPFDLKMSFALYDGTDIAIYCETKEAVFIFYWDGISATFRTQRVQAKVPVVEPKEQSKQPETPAQQ